MTTHIHIHVSTSRTSDRKVRDEPAKTWMNSYTPSSTRCKIIKEKSIPGGTVQLGELPSGDMWMVFTNHKYASGGISSLSSAKSEFDRRKEVPQEQSKEIKQGSHVSVKGKGSQWYRVKSISGGTATLARMLRGKEEISEAPLNSLKFEA